jgi:hypothetical protein
MTAKRVALWCLTGLGISAGSLNADNFAFMGSSVAEFGTVDLNTGVVSLTGFTTLGGTPTVLSGLVALGGTLYGADLNQPASNLYTVNTATGALPLSDLLQ